MTQKNNLESNSTVKKENKNKTFVQRFVFNSLVLFTQRVDMQ